MEKKLAARGFGVGCISKLLLLAFVFLISQYFFSRFSSTPVEFPPEVNDQVKLKVYVAELPREFNYGLLESYWEQQQNNSGRIRRDEYPENPLLKQHSAEFWLLRELERPMKTSAVTRVWDALQADVIFVPFFAALSAQMQLRGAQHGIFTKRVKQNPDFDRQRRVVEIIKNTPEWRRSNGMDHVFVLADPMAMWHFRSEICSAIFLVVDFGGWYLEDAKSSRRVNSTSVIQHTQVSPIKDVIVPHTHLLPTLNLSEDKKRTTLLYFRGARHRHRRGLVRDKLWKVLESEPGVVLEEGLPDAPGLEQASRGMRSSEFCLSPAGDTPSSCRLYDAIASLCIPVIVSDDIQLPFEGLIDYDRFAVFVSTHEAIRPGFLVQKLRSIREGERYAMRLRLAEVQKHYEYDIDDPAKSSRDDGAVSLTWMRIHSKLPVLKESIARFKRNSRSNSPPAIPRCHCVS